MISLAFPQGQAGQVILVTGPARSGKSEWAENLAMLWTEQPSDTSASHSVTYVATAQTNSEDAEWNQRIETHRRRRPQTWRLEEVQEDLSPVLKQANHTECLLIDSLGTWLAHSIDWEEGRWRSQIQSFLAALEQCPALVILVAEETGWGVVPAYQMGRCFRDRLGLLTRCIGQQADAVYLATGGHVLPLHQIGYPLPKTKLSP